MKNTRAPRTVVRWGVLVAGALESLCWLALSAGLAAAAEAVVVTYPAPQGETRSPDYTVTVDGKPVDVYVAQVRPGMVTNGGPYSFAYFDFSGTVEVEISTEKPLDQLRIQPLSKGIIPAVSGHTMRFSLSAPAQLSIEPDRKIGPLLLFANPLEEDAPQPGDPGVVYYGPGSYRPNRINLRSNQTLYLAGGAVVKAAVNVQGTNIAIRGRGILDGTDWPQWNGPQGHMVQIEQSRNVLVEGIIVRGSWAWTVVPAGSDSVTIQNLKICGSRVESDDGIDIVNSQHVFIRDSFIRTDDDCIAPKGMGYGNRNTEDIQISHCVFWTDRAHIWRIGCESRAAAMRDIVSRDIDVVHWVRAWFFTGPVVASLQPAEDMPLENVRFEDIRVNGEATATAGQKFLIEVQPQFTQWAVKKTPGRVRKVSFRNFVVYGDSSEDLGRILVRGPDSLHTVEGVTFENVVRYGVTTLQGSPRLDVADYASKVVFLAETPSTAVDGDWRAVPTLFALDPAFPNPANPATTIPYLLPGAVAVRLEVYDLLGQRVAVLVDQVQGAGYHQVVWDGRSETGATTSSGVYLYRLQARTFSATRKLLLVK